MRNKQRRRFDIYNPHGDLGNPEEIGTLPCAKDFDFGCPNLERDENLTLVGSNSSLKECLLVRLKWRPDAEKQVATLVSRLTLTLGEETFEFAQVETYKPSESPLRPGRITQYGSSASKLKVHVLSPYRRMRISFNGHLKRVVAAAAAAAPSGTSDEKPKIVFLKFGCVLNPFSEIYDFLNPPNEQCLREIHAQKRPLRTLRQVMSDLIPQDRHEQRLRFNGEYLLVDASTQPAQRTQAAFTLWGFQARHFLGGGQTYEREKNIITRRLYATFNNGQGFQMGTRKFDSDEIDFGYTAFDVRPSLKFIERPFKLDRKLEPGLEKFKFEISGHKHTFEGHAERRHQPDWFKVEMNGKPGWGWLSLDDELVENEAEAQAIERRRDEQELAMESGRVCGLMGVGAVSAAPESDQAAAQQPLVVSIEDDCCVAGELVGAKAASLAHLVRFARVNRAGTCSVPMGFVLTRFAHDLLLAENGHLRQAIEELKRFVAQGGASATEGQEALRVECKKLEALVREEASLPQRILDELWTRLEARYEQQLTSQSGGPLFAVRSSSWGEDEEEMSAAGQLTTVLNVKPHRDDLRAAIMSCFASKFSSENIEYKRQHGQSLDMPMAVVVQEMVACEKAGVMFTCDPTTGDESVITITANYGLGESVVSAQADPDSIRVRVAVNPREYSLSVEGSPEELEIEQVDIGKKNVVIDAGEQEQQQHLDKSKCCLSDEEILRLARCGQDIKRYFWSQRRDIEWGFKGGQLHLFQSRPVTGLEAFSLEELIHELDRPTSSEMICASRANIGEVTPYAASPMALTFTLYCWSIIGYRMVAKFQPKDLSYVPQVSVDVFQEKYHSFFSVRCSQILSLSEEQKSVMAKSMEIGMFGRDMGPQPEIVEASRGFTKPPNAFTGTRFDWFTLPIRLMPKQVIMREQGVMVRMRDDVRNLKLAKGYQQNKLLGLYNQMKFAVRAINPCWENHICIIMFATNNNLVLSAVLSKYIKDPMQLSAATNKFLAISPDVISAEIPERIKSMAEMVAAKGREELEQFARMPSEQALEYLKGEGGKLARAYEDFCATFGHRCYNEFEIATRAWREEPKQIVEMIQQNCAALAAKSAESATGAQEETREKARPRTIDDVIKSLGVEMSLKDRLLVKYVLAPKCQLMLSMREKTKNILILHTDVLREATRLLAAEFVRQLRIPDADLFYYLTYEEIEPLVRDFQPSLVMQAVRRRQMFKRMFSEIWKFDEIIWEIVPHHMKPNKELDEAIAQAPKLVGTPASSGKVQGKVCLVNGYKELDKVRPGSILLTHSTDIAFSPIFPLISGIITEVGGLISHGAVVAREYGLPSVIGIPDVTMILQDGEEIILDADNGAIIRLSKSQASEAAATDSKPAADSPRG